MLLTNIDINEYINKHINVNEILILRNSYKKNNNFKICKYHNLTRTIKLYSKFKINLIDKYKIELLIPTNIKYINENMIDDLKENGLQNIYKIKIEKKLNYNNFEDITLHLNITNNLLKILLENYIIYNLDIYIYYLCLEKEILYNFKNILINTDCSPELFIGYYEDNYKDNIIDSVYRYLGNNDYILKEFNTNKYNIIFMIFNRLY